LSRECLSNLSRLHLFATGVHTDDAFFEDGDGGSGHGGHGGGGHGHGGHGGARERDSHGGSGADLGSGKSMPGGGLRSAAAMSRRLTKNMSSVSSAMSSLRGAERMFMGPSKVRRTRPRTLPWFFPLSTPVDARRVASTADLQR